MLFCRVRALFAALVYFGRKKEGSLLFLCRQFGSGVYIVRRVCRARTSRPGVLVVGRLVRHNGAGVALRLKTYRKNIAALG